MKGLKLSDIPKILQDSLRIDEDNFLMMKKLIEISDIPIVLQDSLGIDDDNKHR